MTVDPVATTNGSSTLTYTTSVAHGLAIGDTILISGLKSGKGWAASEVNGEFVVTTVPSTTTFTITADRNSTKNGSFGDVSGSVEKLLGRGLGQIWTTGDGDDVSVRVANSKGTSYNFIIVEDLSGDGFICYDTTDRNANFATLSGAGCQTEGVAAGTCECK